MFHSRYCFVGWFIHVDIEARIEEDLNFQFVRETNSNMPEYTMDYYRQIFKRKSFHLFKDTDTITDDEIKCHREEGYIC